MHSANFRSKGMRGLAGVLAAAAGVFLLAGGAAAQQDRKSWKDYGGGPDNSHYMTLDQINKKNVANLQMAWSFPTRDGASYLQNPLVVDGVAYVVARSNSLVALDATTGKPIWIHAKLGGIEGRGINYWESKDRKDRRLVFVLRSQLQEIDAQTGKSILSFGDNGFVDLKAGIERDPSTIDYTGPNTPGKVFEDLVILGSSTGDGYMSPHGDIRAYNVITGKLAWQFHTLPRPGDRGYDTWPKDAYKYIGSLANWGELSVDAKRGVAYIVTSEPAYGFYGADRTGQDLFANCILALDARTGKYLWHFQEVHHDLWDYDVVSAPQLLTIQHDGKSVDVVAQAGKTGFLYVLDRDTGKPIWPIEERPVPQSTMPGEHSWPTQPFPTAPPPFGRQSMTADDVDPYLPPDLREAARKRVAEAHFQGLFTPPGPAETLEIPGNRGGANWGTTASNPSKGIMYVLTINAPSLLTLTPIEPTAGGIGPIAEGGLPGDTPGQKVYQENCAACHGANRAGNGEIPSLLSITSRVSPSAIRGIIQNGQGRMPPRNLTDEQIDQVIDYLTDKVGGSKSQSMDALMAGRDAAGEVPADDSALIVQSGGVPAGEEAAAQHKPGPRQYGLMDHGPYPPGVEQYARYYTGWNVFYDLIKPPWNTLTAYDLNQGTIKWQIPIGDPPGVLLEQRGVMVTSSGLVFVATGDGKVKAYDGDTGDILWTGTLPGGSRTIPAMYEAHGREYLLVSATQAIETPPGSPAPSAPENPLTSPRGYVAFALPETDKK